MTIEQLFGYASALGIGGVATFLGQAALARMQNRDQRTDADAGRRALLNQHVDNLILKLVETVTSQLEATRAEMMSLKEQIAQYERLEWRIDCCEEGLEHIRALQVAHRDGGWDAADHNAEVFLAKVQAMNQAGGRLANRIQNQRAARGRAGDMGDVEE